MANLDIAIQVGYHHRPSEGKQPPLTNPTQQVDDASPPLDHETIHDNQHTIVFKISYVVGQTINDILARPELMSYLTKLPTQTYAISIFGILVKPEHLPAPQDRIEICLPLVQDPKTRRRQKLK